MKTLSAIWPIEMSTTEPAIPKYGGSTVMNSHAYTLKNSTWKMELNATRPAAYSVEPRASSFQTITIAMQRARPIMMRPTMYSGLSCRKTIARANISTGPTIQFCTSDSIRTFRSRKTSGSSS